MSKSPQSLAFALDIKRKNKKKFSKGGMVNESAKSEQRPMPSETDQDSKMVSRNDGMKPPRDDSWSSNTTVRQAQKPSLTRLSQPKIVGSDAFSVRNRDQRDENNDQIDAFYPQSKAQPKQRYNEEGPDRQGPKVSDMELQHNNKRAAYAKGGMINDLVSMDDAEEDRLEHPAGLEDTDSMMSPPEDEYMADHFADGGMIDDEMDMEHDDSIAAAIMAKRQKYAEGGEILSHDSIYSDDSDQVDLSRNADEDANEEDQLSFNALRKENYSETPGLNQLDQPEDSNLMGDSREDDESDPHDMVSSIRSKMNAKRQFKQR